MNVSYNRLMHEAREIALNLLFQVDVAHIDVNEAIETARAHVSGSVDAIEMAVDLVRGALDYSETSEAMIRELAPAWPPDRQPSVDRNILRLAIFELANRPQTPAAVVMNEAIELAKTFSTDESGKFVNGVLAEYQRKHAQPEPTAETEDQ